MVALVVETENMQDDEVAVRLGRGLKQARMSAGVSGAELARRLTATGLNEAGFPSSQIYRWEAGERPLNLRLIEAAERVMGLRAGTILRLAGYVDDDGLIDVDTLAPMPRYAIGAILEQAARNEAIRGDGEDGV